MGQSRSYTSSSSQYSNLFTPKVAGTAGAIIGLGGLAYWMRRRGAKDIDHPAQTSSSEKQQQQTDETTVTDKPSSEKPPSSDELKFELSPEELEEIMQTWSRKVFDGSFVYLVRFLESWFDVPIVRVEDQATLDRMREKAEKGDAMDELQLGLTYLASPHCRDKDNSQATYWITKAANQSLLAAQLLLAEIHVQPEAQFDINKAVELYEKVAQSDSSDSLEMTIIHTAILRLVLLRTSSSDAKYHDEKEAIKLLTRCVEKFEDHNAASKLGVMYASGKGCDRDVDRAIQYLTLAAADEPQAKFELGSLLSKLALEMPDRRSEEARKMMQEAVDHLASAYKEGISSAAFSIATLFVTLSEDMMGKERAEMTGRAEEWFARLAGKNETELTEQSTVIPDLSVVQSS